MKNQSYLIIVILAILNLSLSLNLKSQVAVNSSGEAANTSAMLDVSSADKGILIPRMTKAQRDAITVSSEQNGLMIYQTDNTPGFYFYNGSAWVVVGDGATSINSLSDGVSDGNSVFLGGGAGTNDNGTTNYNTATGVFALKEVIGGDYNSAFGTEALRDITSGTYNVGFGRASLLQNETGNYNVAIGANAGYKLTGSGNIFIGCNAGFDEIDINNKLFIENSHSSTPLIYGEFDNDLLKVNGTLELFNGTSASSLKFYEPSGSGSNYTIFQSQAQVANVTYTLPAADGSSDQVLKTNGSGSLSWADDTNTGATDINGLSDAKTGGLSVFLGEGSGASDDGSDNKNTGIGYQALYVNNTGYRNTAIGYKSLQYNTTGRDNVAIGYRAMDDMETGSYNVAIGKFANSGNTGGSSNTIIGFEAGGDFQSYSSASGCVFLGYKAGYNEKSSDKLYIENSSSSTPLIYGEFDNDLVRINGDLEVTGSTNISISMGINDLSDAETDASSVFLGSYVGEYDDGDNYATAVGKGAFANNTSGKYNTAIGSYSLNLNTTGETNVSIGSGALRNNTTGNANVSIGSDALRNNTSASDNTAIGFEALKMNTTGETNTAVGESALEMNTTGNNLSAIGVNALNANTTGNWNCAFGKEALYANTTASENTAMGGQALLNNTTGHHNTALGRAALSVNVDGNNNTAIGADAGNNSTGSGNIFLGYNSGSTETGSNKLYIENSNSSSPLIYGEFDNDLVRINGDLEVMGSTNISIGINDLSDAISDASNVFLGDGTGATDDGNNFATAVGIGAMADNTTGIKNTAVGSYSLNLNTSGGSNTAVGVDALKNNTSAGDNTSIGMESLLNNINGHHNTALGRSSLGSCTEGNYNTAIGADAGPSGSWAFSNTGTFGYDAHATASNYYRFGNGYVESIGSKVGWSAWSDKRFKKNINANVPGLDFILKLQPVSYNWDIQKLNAFIGSAKSNEQSTEEQKKVESIVYTGFLAQDVEEAANEIGYDFSGVETPPNDGTPYSLRYAEFVVPLVKAVQEQQEIIKKQTTENEEMKNLIADLIVRIEKLERK